jgi:hypothetical protein
MPRSGALSTPMQASWAMTPSTSARLSSSMKGSTAITSESSCSLVRRTAKAPRRNPATRSWKDRRSATMRDAGPLPVAAPTAVEEYLSERRALLGTTPLRGGPPRRLPVLSVPRGCERAAVVPAAEPIWPRMSEASLALAILVLILVFSQLRPKAPRECPRPNKVGRCLSPAEIGKGCLRPHRLHNHVCSRAGGQIWLLR